MGVGRKNQMTRKNFRAQPHPDYDRIGVAGIPRSDRQEWQAALSSARVRRKAAFLSQ